MTVTTGSRKLLVSVRSVDEAKAAMAGGADIIDVKDPNRGSLGRADERVIAAIAEALSVERSAIAMSAALGEVCEPSSPDGVCLPEAISFAKIGLSRLRRDVRWIERWLAHRQAYDRSRSSNINWIAVIYADEETAESPPATDIIDAAADTGCVGVLVDTYSKTGGRLLDHVSPNVLAEWAARVHRGQMMFAVAGRLSMEDLSSLSEVDADVIAVRSAVCEGQNRQAAVLASRVTALRNAIDEMLPHLTSTRSHALPLPGR